MLLTLSLRLADWFSATCSAMSLRAAVGRVGRSPYRGQAATAKRTRRVSNLPCRAGDCFATLAMTRRLLRYARN